VTPTKGSENSLVHGKESDLSCLFLEEDGIFLEETFVHLTRKSEHQHANENKIWKLYFDEAKPKEGNGTRILLVSLEGNLVPLSFKLDFEATNNIVEYEAFLLALQTDKKIIIIK